MGRAVRARAISLGQEHMSLKLQVKATPSLEGESTVANSTEQKKKKQENQQNKTITKKQ